MRGRAEMRAALLAFSVALAAIGCSDDATTSRDDSGSGSKADGTSSGSGCSKSCSGCCNSQGNCVDVPHTGACGRGGAACVACGSGESCVNGACKKASGCTTNSCPTGCCQSGECQSGDKPSACGKGGAACKVCALDEQCTKQACSK